MYTNCIKVRAKVIFAFLVINFKLSQIKTRYRNLTRKIMFHINTLKKISNLLVVVLLVQQRNAYAHDLGKVGKAAFSS